MNKKEWHWMDKISGENHYYNEGKEYLRKMTKEDIEFRQGRSKKQYENNAKVGFYATVALFFTILSIIVYGLLTV
jgi:hypothetical protein|tara:strand:+ start:328 stop:552 length:225 start_codon:yes stop_codon:yes gene_type:complete